eukprot:2324_1
MMGNKNDRIHRNVLENMANKVFATPRSRKMVLFVLGWCIMFIVYNCIFPQHVHYDSFDHRNAAQHISYSSCYFQNKPLIMKEITWDLMDHSHSSCLCGKDNYCRCGPSPATDIIAFTPDMNYIVLVDRDAQPLGLATVGGFVEVGEQIEEAAKREFKEETNLEIDNLLQVHTYSNPHQDPRRPAISTVFIAKIKANEVEHMAAGDDAKGIIRWSVRDALDVMNAKWNNKFGFESHRTYITDALDCAHDNKWIDKIDILNKH